MRGFSETSSRSCRYKLAKFRELILFVLADPSFQMVRESVEMDPRDSDVCVQGSAFDKMNHSLSIDHSLNKTLHCLSDKSWRHQHKHIHNFTSINGRNRGCDTSPIHIIFHLDVYFCMLTSTSLSFALFCLQVSVAVTPTRKLLVSFKT